MDFKSYFSNPLDGDVMDIEYSVLFNAETSFRYHGNSEHHFRKAIECGFDGLKADMEMTSDGEIVLCHDRGYTLDVDGRIAAFDRNNHVCIRDLSLSQVQQLAFVTPDEQGRHYPPCTLDMMLKLCRENGRFAYLTLRYEPWQAETAKRMVKSILDHDMQDMTIINLFPGKAEAVRLVDELLPGLVYCNTTYPDVLLDEDVIDFSAEVGFKIICLCQKHADTITPERVKYAASKGIRIWTWGASTMEETVMDLSRGVTGFQMCSYRVTPEAIKGMKQGR